MTSYIIHSLNAFCQVNLKGSVKYINPYIYFILHYDVIIFSVFHSRFNFVNLFNVFFSNPINNANDCAMRHNCINKIPIL